MLADSLHNNISGRLTKGIEPNSAINSILEYLEVQLGYFVEKNKGCISFPEDTLNERLVIILQRNIGFRPYFFKPEKIQNPLSGSSPKTDIGVLSIQEKITVLDFDYNEYESFFEIECKRLPTPGQNREKEYVVGHVKSDGKLIECGGIERFKKTIHGDKLKYAAIIGYIQKEDANHWFLKVNEWISELVVSTPHLWKEDDKLIQNQTQIIGLDKFTSKNHRIDKLGNEYVINLFHFWINLVE